MRAQDVDVDETSDGTAPGPLRSGDRPVEPIARAIRARARQIGGTIGATFAGGPEAPRGLACAVPARPPA